MTQGNTGTPSNVVPIGAAKPKKGKAQPYNLDANFERALVTMLCCRPKMYGKVVRHLDEDSFGLEPSKLALAAALEIWRDNNRTGPESLLIVTQRLRAWMSTGKITRDQVVAVSDMFDAAMDAGLPSERSLVAEMKPLLVRRAEREGIETALSEFNKKDGDVTVGLKRIQQVRDLDKVDEEQGTRLGPRSFEELEAIKELQRLRTGVLELDDALGGGTKRGTLCVYMAGSGVGKSMALVQTACAAALQNFRVAYATLELPKHIIMARLKAHLTGIPIDVILADPKGCGAEQRINKFLAWQGFGGIDVREFTPKMTRVQELQAWIKELEDKDGEPIDVLVVDYGDKLGATTRAAKDDSTYQSQGEAYEGLYIFARDEKRWVITASQGQRNKDKGDKKLDMDDVADSMHKVRTADYLISLNARDDDTTVLWFVAKNRLGMSRMSVGPLPCDFECARIAPVCFPKAVLV